MGENHIGQGDVKTNYMPPDVGKLFFQDASNTTEGDGAKLARVAEVTGKGLAETPKGIADAAVNFVKPENWGRDAEMIGSSALVGVALRVALPESGALKTAAGLVMGYMMVKDAAKPVLGAWDKVWKDGSQKTMTEASKEMGTGMGNFVVDGGISLVAAGAAAKFTPGMMNRVAPKTWETIETWKAKNLGAGTVEVGHQSSENLVNRTPVQAHETTVRADVLSKGPKLADMSPEQLRTTLESANTSENSRLANNNLTRFGIKGSDGNYHSKDDVIEMLLAGKDPSMEPAGVRTAKTVSLAEVDLTKPEVRLTDDKTPSGESAVDVKKGGAGGDKGATPAAEAGKPTDLTRATDKVAETPVPTTEAMKILNPKTMAAQAESIKAALETISDQDGLIMDAMNRNLGAIDVRTNPNVKPLTGYEVPRQAAFDLAQQVGTDAGSFQQVNNLYERFAAGALQSGTAETSDIAAHVARMDQYAKENFETYRDNIVKAGIDPDVALAQKPQAPLVEGTSDVERVGTDPDGNPVFAHEGPHTVRAIYGPNGEPVWPIDLVKTPIREIGMRGVNTSGIYGHEYMHDQFGHLAEFDPEIRDSKLGEAAGKAWGKDADKMVDLPNGGKDPQQVLLDAVERKMAKVPDADKPEFLSEQLGLDQRTRVIRAARAADEVLGDTGKKMVNIPGSGPMPLELFVGNIAAMADERLPMDIMNELRGKGTPDVTAKNVAANVDKILGANGKQVLPLSDGTHITLKDAVMKVSDMTRNPKFDTYDKALPSQMSNRDILVNVAKAWADETFADWGAAAESGQTAAPYFQALAKDGLLRTSTVMGQEMRSPSNELGIEAHPTDVLRPRYQAALVRALATAKGGHDQVLLDWADALENYAKHSAKPGPVTLPSLDTPGKSIAIPQEVFDKFIPELVDAQLNTPLPRLQGKTLFDILPDLRKNFRINQGLADGWVDAIKGGKDPEGIAFDAPKTKMTNVYGAGQLTFLKLVSEGMDPVQANEAVNKFSDFFGDQIVKDRASTAAPLGGLPPKLNFSRMSRGIPEGAFKMPGHSSLTGQLTGGVNMEGIDPSVYTTTAAPSRLGRAFSFVTSPDVAAANGAYHINDLLGMHQLQQNVVQTNDKQK